MNTKPDRRGIQLGARIAPDIVALLKRQAQRSGQSITNTVERAVMLGLAKQQEWEVGRNVEYKESLTSLFDTMTDIVKDNPKWLDNSEIFKAVKETFIEAIEAFDPFSGDEQ